MLRVLLAILVLVPSLGWAADGIIPGKEFRIPFSVDDVPLKLGGKATVTFESTGRGTLRVLYGKGEDGVELFWSLTRMDGNPNPTPTPSPTPTPTPTPAPTPAKAAYVYLIHESGDSTPAETAVRFDKAWKDRAEALKMRWLVTDKNTAAKSLPVVTSNAIKVGLPVVAWLDAAGLATYEKCPSTPAAMLAFVNKIGGAK